MMGSSAVPPHCSAVTGNTACQPSPRWTSRPSALADHEPVAGAWRTSPEKPTAAGRFSPPRSVGTRTNATTATDPADQMLRTMNQVERLRRTSLLDRLRSGRPLSEGLGPGHVAAAGAARAG